MKVFKYTCNAGFYEADGYFKLGWEIFKHRIWHLYKHSRWMD